LGKTATHLLPPVARNRGGAGGRRRPWGWRRPGRRGKGGGAPGESIPLFNFRGDPLGGRDGHGRDGQAAAMAAAQRGAAAAGARGKSTRGSRGSYPRSHLGRRGSEEAARLWQAAAGFGVRGGSDVAKGRGRAVAGRLVKLESDSEGLLIGEVRR